MLAASKRILLGMAGRGRKTVNLGAGEKMKFIWCPPGEFMMGSEKGDASEKPVHRVRIMQGFWLGKCEVTQIQWKAVMGTEPWKGKLCVLDHPDSPAVYVSWEDAQAFCRKVGKEFRLPSEAEWEYACRAGSNTEYCFGDDVANLADYAWCDKNALETGTTYAHPVARKKPNHWGLHDMHGNVWEWCQDRCLDSYQGAPSDGSAWEQPAAGYRVVRGGSWLYYPKYCRSANRGWLNPYHSSHNFGFRLLHTP
jgi:formylglycine-generating enzyme required for sulfatase activity